MTYLLPRLETAGNKPVWSAYMRDFTSWLMMSMQFFFWWSKVVGKSSAGLAAFVEQNP